MKKYESFFQTAVLEAGLKVAVLGGSLAANSETKQDEIFLSDKFCYKSSFFNRLNKDGIRLKTTTTSVYSANHPKISPLVIIKLIYNY
jgi:hypothetical protein